MEYSKGYLEVLGEWLKLLFPFVLVVWVSLIYWWKRMVEGRREGGWKDDCKGLRWQATWLSLSEGVCGCDSERSALKLIHKQSDFYVRGERLPYDIQNSGGETE